MNINWTEVEKHIFDLNLPSKPWRRIRLCATVPWTKKKSGRRARKAAFAHSARKARHWLAAFKKQALAHGAYYLP